MRLPAQSWQPTKPITIVIPFPPGPGLDLVARMVGDKLSAQIGQPVVYENRTGASGSIAAEYVARAAPDGYTLMAAATSTHATNVHLIKNLSYDPVKNFTPIVTSVETIGCLVVNRNVVPVEFGDRACRLRQEESRQAVVRLLGRRLVLPSGRRAVQPGRRREDDARAVSRLGRRLHRPHRRPYPGQFHPVVPGHGLSRQSRSSRCWRCWRQCGSRRIRNIRRSPTSCRRSGCRRPGTASSARPECPSRWWRGSTPSSIKALNIPEVKSKLEDNGYRVVGGTPEEFGKRISGDIAFYGPIFKSVGVEAQ